MGNAETSFILSSTRASTLLSKKADNQLSIHGLNLTEYTIMRHLSAAPAHTMRRIELAECVGISASGVTRLLAPLEKIGIVQKESNPRDARVSLVKLTSTGQTLYKDATVSFNDCAKSLLSKLSKNQLNAMSELVQKLVR